MTSKKWTDVFGFLIATAFFLTFAFSLNALAQTKIGKIFQEVTSEAGLTAGVPISLAFGDFDNDGLVDFLTPTALFKNTTQGNKISFRDVTAEVGLQGREEIAFPIFADFNNDGLLDIATTGGNIYLQTGQHQFVDFSKAMGFEFSGISNVISAADYDRDGWIDLIVGIQEKYEESLFFPPKVFRNNQGKGFSEVSSLIRLDQFPAYARGIVWADYNNDQYADAFFSNYRLRPSFLFKNKEGVLSEEAAGHGVQGEYNPNQHYDETMKTHYGRQYGHATGSAWVDFNNDGNFDLWVSKLVHLYVGPVAGGYDYRGYLCDDSKIYKNLGAPSYQFVNVRSDSGLPVKPMGGPGVYQGDELWFHTTTADFDNDGLVDVQVGQVYDLNYSYNFLFKNQGDFKFTDVGDEQGIRMFDARTSGWADLDNDGKMDFVVVGKDAPGSEARTRVFQNVMNHKNNFLKVKLVGTQSGKTPVTTQVRLFHSHGLFLKQVEGTTGVQSQQNDPTLHFGLGKIKKIDRMEISWSSGQKQTLKNIRLNSTLTVTEPQ